MKIFVHIVSAITVAFVSVQVLFGVSPVNLNVKKDLVISETERAKVLELGHQIMSEKSESFLALVKDAETPFLFEQPAEEVVFQRDDAEVVEKPAEEIVVNYDDASVLRVVVKNFSAQVRGILARGNSSFLQLKGGRLIKPGASFPVSIPQEPGQVFTVNITEVTSDSYTLQLGEASETVSLVSSGSGSGATKTN